MFARSILFYLLLGIWTIFMGIACLPYFILPFAYLRQPIKIWISGIFLLLKNICKITHVLQGKENIPLHSVLIASKHQSAFETFALFYYIPNSIFIHKKQLFLIPIFGQYLKKINMISIDRQKGISAIRSMMINAKKKLNDGYSIIIFPEGTRKKPGDKPDYKSGFVAIYNEMKTKILPIALNSGNCWPKNTFILKPGHIIIKIMPLIEENLKKNEILSNLQTVIENETNKII